MSISGPSFAYIRALLAERSAIVLDDAKEYLVENRLLPLAKRAGLHSIDELVARLRMARDDLLQQAVVEAMTTNETSFFRDEVPFRTLRTVILPDLFARRRHSRQLCIWSAGCASGQEPYSIAMLLREHFAHFHPWNVQLLGTDISADVLAKARSGRFTRLEVGRGLPPPLLQKYFRQIDEDWQLNDAILRMAEFRQFNLDSAWPPLPLMDIILLRNVLVYFDMPTRKRILLQVRRVLRDDGYLLLGGAETALHADDTFEVVRDKGFSYYQIKTA